MLVYEIVSTRSAIKETGLKEASHYYTLTSSPIVTEEKLSKGLSHIMEQVDAGADPTAQPAVFNIYKIVTCTGYTEGAFVFLKKVGYYNGEKVVKYDAEWTVEDAQQIVVTTTKTVAISAL